MSDVFAAIVLVLGTLIVFILVMRRKHKAERRPRYIFLDEPPRPSLEPLKLSQTQPHLTKRVQHLALTHKQRARRIRRRRAGEQI